MANTESITGYLQGADQYSSAFCGHITFYEVSEGARVNHADFLETLAALDLGAFSPNPPRDGDIFSRVTSAAQQMRQPIPDSENKANFLVRKVKHDTDSITKHIVVEVVDSGNKRLTFTEVVSMEFDSKHSTFKIIPIPAIIDQRLVTQAVEIAQGARTEFLRWQGFLDSDAIRRFTNRVVVGAHATSLKTNGGFYFVPKSQMPKINALKDAVETIAGARVHTIPLVDTEDQRELVRRSYQSESIGEAQRLTKEINELFNTGAKINSRTTQRILTDIATLQAKAEEYTEFIEANLGSSSLHLEALVRAKQKLVRLG